MTERELSQAVHLKTELDALRRVAALEPNPEVLVMAFIATIPDLRIHPENRNILADGGPVI